MTIEKEATRLSLPHCDDRERRFGETWYKRGLSTDVPFAGALDTVD